MQDCYYNGRNRCSAGRTPVRSAGMRAEEIDRERAMSGWNPYRGEEETEYAPVWRRSVEADEGEMRRPSMKAEKAGLGEAQQTSDVSMGAEEAGRVGMRRPSYAQMNAEEAQMREMHQPFFVQPEFAQVLAEEKESERDLRMLQSMFPETAKLLLPFIEEACDRMEYEGSAMYDEYPDPTTLQQLEERIYQEARELFSQEEQETAAPDEVLAMQYPGGRRRRRGRGWQRDLIRTLLLQEMHHRRCRHRGCRRWR